MNAYEEEVCAKYEIPAGMKQITLCWEEVVDHSAIVLVPEDFDVDDLDESDFSEAVCDLDQLTYDGVDERRTWRAYNGANYHQEPEYLFKRDLD